MNTEMKNNQNLKNTNSRSHFNYKVYFLFSIFYFLFSFTSTALAATLYLVPEHQSIYQGDTFIVEARINTEEEEINAVEASLLLPLDLLEFVDFSKGDSILNLWVKDPSVSDNTLYFLGGVPGGFKGEGRIGRLILKGKKEGEGSINFKEVSQVLLNDGFGTPAKLSTLEGVFTILSERLEVSEDEWKKELEKDNIPPEIFEIEIAQDPTIFEGKYFLVFSTIDKQTGIDYYEIKEGKREWKRGSSPYLLEDQSLRNKIFVRAIDKAGNERIAELMPARKPFPYWIIIILLGIGILWWLIKRFRKK